MRRTLLCLGAALLVSAITSTDAPATASGAAGDLLILAGGERRSGALTSCDGESCRFDGAPVPLAEVLWIGLGIGEGEAEPPRGVASPGAVLPDGSLTAGKLVGLSQGDHRSR